MKRRGFIQRVAALAGVAVAAKAIPAAAPVHDAANVVVPPIRVRSNFENGDLVIDNGSGGYVPLTVDSVSQGKCYALINGEFVWVDTSNVLNPYA